MSSVKPVLEKSLADRVCSALGRVAVEACSTPTSPKIHELKARYKAAHVNENDCINCRLRMVDDTNLVECLMEGITCQWEMYFGNARCCNHPAAKQFANSCQP